MTKIIQYVLKSKITKLLLMNNTFNIYNILPLMNKIFNIINI